MINFFVLFQQDTEGRKERKKENSQISTNRTHKNIRNGFQGYKRATGKPRRLGSRRKDVKTGIIEDRIVGYKCTTMAA
jgi:hypothetical protein